MDLQKKMFPTSFHVDLVSHSGCYNLFSSSLYFFLYLYICLSHSLSNSRPHTHKPSQTHSLTRILGHLNKSPNNVQQDLTTRDIKLLQFAAKMDRIFSHPIGHGFRRKASSTSASCCSSYLSNNEPIFVPTRMFDRIISRTTV